jgi:hypothetical protein
VWLDLLKLVTEVIQDERERGYLQGRTDLEEDGAWFHWSGDAAGWIRGLKHSKFGFKQVGAGRATAQSPNNIKTCLLFEGKDNWANYKELLAPFLPVMDQLAAEGLTVEDTKYTVKQTFGADYVLMCYDCAWLSLTALSTVTCNLWL